MRSRPWIAGLAAVAIAGCGGDPTLSASRADELHAQVAAVRVAAGKGDRAGALKSLDGLEVAYRGLEPVERLQRAGPVAFARGVPDGRDLRVELVRARGAERRVTAAAGDRGRGQQHDPGAAAHGR